MTKMQVYLVNVRMQPHAQHICQPVINITANTNFAIHKQVPAIDQSEIMFNVCVHPQAIPGGGVQRQAVGTVGHQDWNSSPGNG